jgi:hypothetical protein
MTGAVVDGHHHREERERRRPNARGHGGGAP